MEQTEKSIEELKKKIEELDDKIDGVEENLRIAEYWRIGNGESKYSAENRLREIEENMVRTDQLDTLVRSIFKENKKEENTENRKDWNKWVNTGMLLLMIIGQVIIIL